MENNLEDIKQKQFNAVRTVVNYVVGIIIFAAGLFLLLNEPLKLSVEFFPPSNADKIFGVLCLAYGFWRIYRGVKKKNIQ